jgi:hypothetical protein
MGGLSTDTIQLMAQWILKINATRHFRLADCLREAFVHEGIIALANHQCTPQRGDGVYLYQTGPDRGLCGVAIVLASTSIREQPSWQRKYGVDGYTPGEERVLLRVEMIATEPVPIPGWRANSGTMQSCDPEIAHLFDSAAESFLTADIDSDSRVGLDTYLGALASLNLPGATDRETRTLARVEQAYWRRELFGSRQLCACAICGQLVPRRLIVVAHIKRRSNCTREERLDHNNVMPACLLGCDALFEHRYLTVEDGKLVGHSSRVRSPAVRDAVVRLHGRQLNGVEWTEARMPYFVAHGETLGEN